ncbi:hypothetical protein CEXT_351071 [Caerostris extrusa]|uniref:Uncharacterized protein n=1 Tax=Caerostris extrusa TaxID=172846 RepID=A0AAV4NCM6_CAEEX|nr:hypothetical protein CEXT_351071 [Caerostris extrusa]
MLLYKFGRRTLLRATSKFLSLKCINNRCLSYIQGQSPEPNIREYFYFIDHQGMLFLDDSKMKNFYILL